MKQAVRNAIEIYEKEIAGRPAETNVDDIVNRALARAKEQVDRGQSSLARATLRRAAEEMQREEEDRRERYVAGVTTLYHRERDIALAAYDGDAAASAIVDHARSIHGANATKIAELLSSDAQVLYKHGRDCGSNVHLVAAIALRHEQLALGASGDERAAAQNALGVALATLGQRENGTEKLEAAVEAFRSALAEWTPEQVPLDWARAQNNVGLVLARLGERDSGTVRLEEAVAAYRAALEELTRRRVPLDWAQTQNILALRSKCLANGRAARRGLRSGAAYRAALEERTHKRVPLGWAGTQYNLGNALSRLGGRESGTARLESAVQAYRAALLERTRDRVPLDWARTQIGLGNALSSLGEREGSLRGSRTRSPPIRRR